MRKVLALLFSMSSTGLLLLIFAVSIGYATFIENDFGTTAAKISVYDAVWFKGLLVMFAINLLGSILVNKLISRKKWTVFLFHISFIIILAGAAVTRYMGSEGVMHIREGGYASEYITDKTYMTIRVSDGLDSQTLIRELKLSEKTKNRFKETFTFADHAVCVESIQYLPSVSRNIIEDENGGPVISLLVLGAKKQRQEFVLKKGEDINLNNIVLSFGSPSDITTVLIKESKEGLVLSALRNELSAGTMGSEQTRLPLLEEFPLNEKIIYQIGHITFILKQYVPKGSTRLVPNISKEGDNVFQAIRARISVDGESEVLEAINSHGLPGQPGSSTLNSIDVSVSYGSILKKLPFSLHLNDFQIERYPGSNSPSSFASKLVLKDNNNGVELPFRLYMNKILKYKGYRFFQSSYDNDEKGTILSVNHDPWGTSITYIGYLLMTLGMLFTLFNKSSRFTILLRASKKLKALRAALLMLVFLSGTVLPTSAQPTMPLGEIEKSHARFFGELLVQSNEGRIEPVNTLASKLLRKVYGENSFKNLSPIQVFLDMNVDPMAWRSKEIIHIPDPEINKMLGISGNYISFDQIMSGGYKLANLVEQAYAKAPARRTKTEMEVLKIDERVNICHVALSGGFLKIFPVPEDDNHSWISLSDPVGKMPMENREFAIRILSNYLHAVKEAKTSENWTQANELLTELKDNQHSYGSSVIPDQAKIKLEIFYVNFKLFNKLAIGYLLIGMVLLLMVFLHIFRPELKLEKLIRIWGISIVALFIFHSLGLALRWYIAGHAPWSNAYESMIFISWGISLSGLLFAKRSHMTLALTTVLAALTLLVAGLSWMSPEITNLVPVLKSYWLIIHVAIITASYGFLGIGSILGLTNLILLILRNEKNKIRVGYTIKELVLIIEIVLILGLYMLTVGAFIGGVWANESWGRYWGWDPKETWTLVTILVYAFIVHMHRIPGCKGHFQISTAALLGFGSVLMTYFGVNYYFSGLHSYASGEPPPIPTGVYVVLFVIITVIITAFFSNRKTGKDTLVDESTSFS